MANVLAPAPLAAIDDEASLGRAAYAHFLKPRVAEVLEAVGLDVAYSRAEGDYLFCRGASGEEVRVLDMLGGFGASLLGHNHPTLIARARDVLAAKRPFNAQASVRELAGRLADRLSERVKRATGQDCVVTLAATGAEAIEAALKLAELDRGARVARRLREIARTGRTPKVRVAPGALERAARLLGEPIASPQELVSRVLAHAERALDTPPVFLSLERAFHGKSTGALSLTANARFRDAWHHLSLRTVFLPVGDERALARAIEDATVRHLSLRLGADGALDVEEATFVRVAAAFVEPIQGEGGVRVVPDAYLRALRATADAHGFLLVFDEIQCGMGRTGTFLASEPSGVSADAYALSKSLGGGLAKVSALLVDRARYEVEFGLLHTSTFAEDDYASGVALGVLELLDRDDGALLRACATKGEHLRAMLAALAKRYPAQIRDVRGRGLMVGLELTRMEGSPSPFLRVASEQGLLGYVVAGYLLHEEGIRVAPTLSSPETIRLQPSAYVELAELDRFGEAIERVAIALRDRDVLRLTGHLAGRSGVNASVVREEVPAPVRRPGERRRVAFLGHFLEPQHLREWDPAFRSLSPEECRRVLDRTSRALDPFVAHEVTVQSANGGEVDVSILGLAFSPEQVMASFRTGGAKWARDLIGRGVALARERGARVVGFGGYTSIVTDNCRHFAHEDVLVTSGNSLTAAATVEAVLAAKARLRLGRVRLGVVGALGNIGAVLAELLAEHVDAIVLLGRPGARRRLEGREDFLYAAALRRAKSAGEARGIARADGLDALLGNPLPASAAFSLDALVAGMTAVAARDALERSIDGSGEGLGAFVRASLGAAAPIVVATDPFALRGCNVIVAATNAPQPVILPEHLGPAPIVICDVAVPGDVDPRVLRERPDVTVLEGGMVALPLGQRIRVPGMPQGGAEIYGCLAETILTGLADLEESLSLGALRAADVRTARDLARAHGFNLGEKPAQAAPVRAYSGAST
jgi:acetylornithine/succinyldiaminopimelate/putrescine aminotransferase/predicted amino acid dehydrogenase